MSRITKQIFLMPHLHERTNDALGLHTLLAALAAWSIGEDTCGFAVGLRSSHTGKLLIKDN